jgi:hypothetical protein
VSKQSPIGPLGIVLLVTAALASIDTASAEPKSIVILRSRHNLDYARNACDTLRKFTDVEAVTRLVKNAPENDPSVKSNREVLKGISECESVGDPRELGRRLEAEIVHQVAANSLCRGVSAYIEGDDKYDGKFNDAAMAAEKDKAYWLLLVDYVPGSEAYAWSLFPENMQLDPRSASGRLISGEGTSSQIAAQICTDITKRGANAR